MTPICALACFAAVGAGAQGRYSISGVLTNQNNATIRLNYRDGERQVANLVNASNGVFTISGPAPSHPVVASLNTGVDRNIHLGLAKNSMVIGAPPLLVVLDTNSTLTVVGSAQEINLAQVEGDELNQSFNLLRQAELPFTVITARLQQEFADIKLTGDEDGLKALGPKMVENRRGLIAAHKQFVRDHPAAFASLWLLSTTEEDYEAPEFKTAYESLAPALRASELGQQVAYLLEHPSVRKPRPGQPKIKPIQP